MNNVRLLLVVFTPPQLTRGPATPGSEIDHIFEMPCFFAAEAVEQRSFSFRPRARLVPPTSSPAPVSEAPAALAFFVTPFFNRASPEPSELLPSLAPNARL